MHCKTIGICIIAFLTGLSGLSQSRPEVSIALSEGNDTIAFRELMVIWEDRNFDSPYFYLAVFNYYIESGKSEYMVHESFSEGEYSSVSFNSEEEPDGFVNIYFEYDSVQLKNANSGLTREFRPSLIGSSCELLN